jgi:hypothetical protein
MSGLPLFRKKGNHMSESRATRANSMGRVIGRLFLACVFCPSMLWTQSALAQPQESRDSVQLKGDREVLDRHLEFGLRPYTAKGAALDDSHLDGTHFEDLQFHLAADEAHAPDTRPSDAVGHSDPASTGSGDSSHDLAMKLQNPVAALISVPFQFNWDNGLGENKDGNRILLNIQPVIPITLNEDWNIISRTILPVVWEDADRPGVGSEFGMGDVLQSFFFSPVKPVDGWILGVGPAMQFPTGTDDLFRSKQFSLGPTGVALRQEHGWTYGILANHLWHLCGSDDVPDVNATFLQPFLTYTFKSLTTIGATSESTYDWNGEQWTVPLNGFVTQLVHIGKLPVQFQFGGRYYLEAPDGGPDWGLRFTVTFLFPK